MNTILELHLESAIGRVSIDDLPDIEVVGQSLSDGALTKDAKQLVFHPAFYLIQKGMCKTLPVALNN